MSFGGKPYNKVAGTRVETADLFFCLVVTNGMHKCTFLLTEVKKKVFFRAVFLTGGGTPFCAHPRPQQTTWNRRLHKRTRPSQRNGDIWCAHVRTLWGLLCSFGPIGDSVHDAPLEPAPKAQRIEPEEDAESDHESAYSDKNDGVSLFSSSDEGEDNEEPASKQEEADELRGKTMVVETYGRLHGELAEWLKDTEALGICQHRQATLDCLKAFLDGLPPPAEMTLARAEEARMLHELLWAVLYDLAAPQQPSWGTTACPVCQDIDYLRKQEGYQAAVRYARSYCKLKVARETTALSRRICHNHQRPALDHVDRFLSGLLTPAAVTVGVGVAAASVDPVLSNILHGLTGRLEEQPVYFCTHRCLSC